MSTSGFKCYNQITGAVTYVHMRIFYPQCPTLNLGVCNPYKGAYLPAVTICQLYIA